MAAIDDLLAKKPRTRSVTIVTDPDATPPSTVTLTFRALPREQWRKLVDAHPATDEQQNEYAQVQARQGIAPSKMQRLLWHADTFPPAAVAACAVDPELSLAEAEALWGSEAFNEDELARIFSAVLAANMSPEGSVVWGKGSGTTPDSETS